MPTISSFFGIVIYMHWRDHAPPHFHALYAGQEALIDIRTGDVIAGDLPNKAKRLLKDWAAERQGELLRNWEHGQLREPFEKIPGADVE